MIHFKDTQNPELHLLAARRLRSRRRWFANTARDHRLRVDLCPHSGAPQWPAQAPASLDNHQVAAAKVLEVVIHNGTHALKLGITKTAMVYGLGGGERLNVPPFLGNTLPLPHGCRASY